MTEIATAIANIPLTQKLQSWISRVLLVTLAFLSCAFILLFFWVALSRLHFPLQLEWLEGGILDTAVRVLHHQAIYVEPTYRFVNGLYTPLYYYVGALFIRGGGPSLGSLRMISIASTAGCLLILFLLTQNITRDKFAALLSSGLFAALYGAVDGWYDLARVDMLYLFLTLLAIFLSYRSQTVLAALVFILAYQTKQGAGMVAVFVLLHEIGRPRKIITGMSIFLAGTFASVLYLNHRSGGWYDYYTLQILGHQALVPQEFLSFWTRDLLSHLGLAIAVIAFGLLSSSPKWKEPRQRRLSVFLALSTVGMLVSAFSGRVHSGGAVNAMLPIYAWLCALFGIAVAAMRKMKVSPDSSTNTLAFQVILLLMCVMQFAQLVYPANRMIPSKRANQEAHDVLARIAALPGDYLVWNNCVDLTPIGKPTFATSEAVWEVLRGDHGPAAQALKQSLEDAVANHRFNGVISTGGIDIGFPYNGAPAGLAENYTGHDAMLLTPGQAFDVQTIVTPPLAPAIVHYAKDSDPQPSR